MKSTLLFTIGLLLTLQVFGQEPAKVDVVNSSPKLDELESVIGANHARYRQIAVSTNAGGRVQAATNEFVQLELGLHYRDKDGTWQASQARFKDQDGWAVAREGQHYAALYYNLNAQGSVVLETADGHRLRSNPQGLAYYDTATGESVMLAEVQDSQGLYVAENQILYPAAFAGLAADVRYTYTKAGFEQDIILWEQPPSPQTFGMNPETTQLEVWTEFVESGEPVKELNVLNEEAVAAGNEAPILDEGLQFGSMRIGLGHAFRLGSEQESLSFVSKRWNVTPQGRTFLVETVRTSQIDFDELAPNKGGAALPQQRKNRLQALQVLPKKEPALGKVEGVVWRRPSSDTLIAELRRPGVVLDYSILNGAITNMVFKGDATYYVSGLFTCSGTTTFEGGAVIKFANTNTTNLRIDVGGTSVWPTNNFYRPIVFTSKDDDTVGEIMPGSSGSPSGYYAETALKFSNASSAIDARNIRFANAKTGLAVNSGSGHKFRHVQFVNCETAIKPTSTDFGLHNALCTGVTYVFNGSSSTGRVEHATVNGATALNYNSTFGSGNLRVVNSLMIGITTLGSLTDTNKVAFLSSSAGVFASTVAGGAHYLANGSPYRDLGVTVSAELTTDLPRMTTYPPVLVTSTIGTSVQFSPQNSRDTNAPDLGYHYAPIDFLFSATSGVIVTNAVITLKDGVVISHDRYAGLLLTGNSSLVSSGLPLAHNIVTYYTTVQESKSSTHESGSSKAPIYSSGAYNVGSRSVSTRFTTFEGSTIPAYYALYSLDSLVTQSFDIRDTQFIYADVDIESSFGPFPLAFNNNLWVYPSVTTFGNFPTFLANQTVIGGSFFLFGGALDWRDSLLQGTGVTLDGGGSGVTNRNNLFVSLASFSSSGSNISCITNSSFTFAPSTLGDWYHSSTTGIDAGSRTTALAGLSHHTVKTDQTKDSGSAVDIGFHYVALSGGLPCDADSDGLPDYLEDSNGNNTLDSGETNVSSASDIGLQVIITEPKSGSNLP